MIAHGHLLFFLFLAPHGAFSAHDSDAIRPSKRYTVYCNINVKGSADALGYSESSWNSFSNSLEDKDYETIKNQSPSKLGDIHNLLDGSSSQYEPSWDCWLNHYTDFTWSELGTEGVQSFYSTLGWTQSVWDDGGTAPDSEDKDWSQLSGPEQGAASAVCFDQMKWDGGSLSGNCGDGGGDDGGGAGCFSGTNEVRVRDRGFVNVDRLVIGDYVMTESGEFSRIYSFLHHDRDIELEYLQIYVSGLQKPLEISPEHMMLVSNKMIRASEVKEGDVVGRSQESDQVVKKIKTAQRRGAYAPVTESGDIVVAGVVSSCFVAILEHAPIDQHLANHYLLAPVRLLCSIHFGICEHESYTDGYSTWIFLWSFLSHPSPSGQ